MKKYLPALLLVMSVSVGSFAQVLQWASIVLEFSTELTSGQYSANQILGKPNVMPYGGQNPSAWTPDRKGKKEYIKVGFDIPIEVQQIAIAESANPSALYRVLAYDIQGREHLLHTFNPQPVPKLGMMRNIFVEKTAYKVSAIKLEFDGAAISDYFSIDAVGISDSPYLIVADLNIPNLIAKGILVERLDENVNSEASEINPILSPDGKTLYFSRKNHPENIGGVNDKEDIWYSEKDENGNWQLAKNMGPEFNNAGPNFISSMSAATPDGQSVIMILGNKYLPDGKMIAGVSVSNHENGKWTKPVAIEIENDYNYNEKANYFMSNSRKTLILSVERDDSRGSRDLYVSFLKPDSTWTEPVNLGDNINTASEESAPFLASDNETLYFASNGFSGFGGADIYVSKRLDDTWQSWSDPQNLGPEVNSKLDDLFFNIPANSDYAYYSRGITPENSDIFRIKLPIYRTPNPIVTLRGKLVDSKTGLPLGAKIVYETLPDGKELGSVNSDPKTGEYELKLPAGKSYSIRAEAEGHISESHKIDLTQVTDDKVDTENFNLKPIEVVKIDSLAKISLNTILFAFNKATLLPESYPELNRISDLMSKSANMQVEIAGHTDSSGDEKYNLWLSQWRAESVAKYMVGKGINNDRIRISFFGETKPKESNDTKEGRDKNRRVEFMIIKP
jgi:outer membrane protein OmpA-like peptidoglycan-associated protein